MIIVTVLLSGETSVGFNVASWLLFSKGNEDGSCNVSMIGGGGVGKTGAVPYKMELLLFETVKVVKSGSPGVC